MKRGSKTMGTGLGMMWKMASVIRNGRVLAKQRMLIKRELVR
jgi:hypothetical protein